MRSTAGERADAAVWEVARPARPSPVAGVTMAGFRDRGLTPVGLRLIPPPAVTLALVFGPGRLTVSDATGRQQRGSLVAGLGFETARVREAANFECLQVRLSPVTARAVLGACAADLGGTVVALDDLWGQDASRIAEQLADLSTWEDRFALIDALLARRCATSTPTDAEVSWAWHRIARSRGQVRIDQLALELGWSRKRLWSRFHSQLGLPPKRAARLVRFDHAAHRLVAGHDAAQVAADSGYVDQSHLHRDVMTFTGTTPATLPGEPFLAIDPTAWPNETRPLPDGVNDRR